MKILQLKCPNCNAPIDVLENQKTVKCEYCYTTIFVDDEAIHVKHTIINGQKEERIKNAEALLKLKDYKKAFECYEYLSKEYAYEASIWYSLILCLTEEFTNFQLEILNSPVVNTEECREYLDKYNKLETNDNLKNERLKKYSDYEEKLFKIVGAAQSQSKYEVNKEGKILLIVGVAFIIFGIIVTLIVSAG